MYIYLKKGALLPALLLVSACGGGSGTSGTVSSSVFSSSYVTSWSGYTTAASNLLATVKYNVQNAVGLYDTDGDNVVDARLTSYSISNVGVHFAHAAGLTGRGQIVAVSDEGFRTTHETISDDLAVVQAGLPDANHGTAVASVVTGDTSTMIGVAPNASLIVGHWDTADLADTGQVALARRAVAWNNSWGYVNSQPNAASYNSVFSGANGANYLQALKDYAAYGNVVFSIDNDVSKSSAGLMPALPSLVPELEAGWIAVVNGIPTVVNNDVTSATRVSGACLEAARWCIAADGTWYAATNGSNTSYAYTTGTSFAAPTVSGALALLAEAFPTLTPHELRLRLFATADNTFTGFTTDQVVTLAPGYESAVSNTWGHGFLDVAQALLPIGQITVNSAGGAIDANQPLVMSGTAAGGAIQAALADVELHAVDSFAGAFSIGAAALVQTAKAADFFGDHQARLSGQKPIDDRAISAALFDKDPTLQNSFGDLYVATYLPQSSDQFDTAGFSIGQRHDTAFGHIDWQAGIGSDNGALLPLWQNQNGQDLASLGISLTTELSETAQFQVSAVMASAGPSGDTSSVFMNSAEISYAQNNVFGRNDRLKLSLRQPYAITSGSTNLSLAVRSAGGTTIRNIPVDLSPSDREIQFGVDYEVALSRNTDLMLSMVHAENRGHVAGSDETGVFFGWRKQF